MNITYSLKEKKTTCNQPVTYNDLTELVNCLEDSEKIEEENINNLIAMEINYQTNFTKTQLETICGYYGISKRKKRKDELIQDIVIYELDPINIESAESTFFSFSD